MSTENAPETSDFIRDTVSADLAAGKYPQIVTRFPPEPNGYLHIGHAKSICLNFGVAKDFNGVCNLRMDDTNPAKEEVEYVESIVADTRWLIEGWAEDVMRFKRKGDRSGTPELPGSADSEPFYASDYFEQIHEYAIALIKRGKAYVCDLTPEQTDAYRGAPDKVGIPSPFRDRSIEENLDLFARMKAGEFPNGARTLRAKIDMSAPNVWLRDPLLYRIRHVEHHHVGKAWCIYPMYDFAHCLSDAIEKVSHSICTLEFEMHRPLYDWILENVGLEEPRPHQYEFARLNLTYTVMSKRKLMELVKEGLVSGWDDPRMPTISGLRRRGVTAEAIRSFVTQIGVTRYIGLTEVAVLEHAIRSDLNPKALRRLAVLKPLKLVITNFPEGQTEELDAINLPDAPGTRKIPFTRELYIEEEDFEEVPPPKFFRLRPGGEVRLKYAFIITCEAVIKDETGRVTEVHCRADFDSRSGGPTSARKVKGTIHWVSATQSIDLEVRLYDRLFTEAQPDAEGRDFKQFLNPHSLHTVRAKAEPALADAVEAQSYQFERLGYFCVDSRDHRPDNPVFNRTISLKDAWSKARG